MGNIAHLPRRPVGPRDLQKLNDSGGIQVVPYGGTQEDGEMQIYALKLATDSTAYALGFDESSRSWQQLSSVETANLVEAERYLDEALDEWVLAVYGDRFEVLKSV